MGRKTNLLDGDKIGNMWVLHKIDRKHVWSTKNASKVVNESKKRVVNNYVKRL